MRYLMVACFMICGLAWGAESGKDQIPEKELREYQEMARRIQILKPQVALMQTQLRDAKTLLRQKAEIMRLKYKLGDQDQINPETGEIVRKPIPEKKVREEQVPKK